MLFLNPPEPQGAEELFVTLIDIGVRTGRARGAAAPPKFWATQIFWATRENLGKACFKDVSVFI